MVAKHPMSIQTRTISPFLLVKIGLEAAMWNRRLGCGSLNLDLLLKVVPHLTVGMVVSSGTTQLWFGTAPMTWAVAFAEPANMAEVFGASIQEVQLQTWEDGMKQIFHLSTALSASTRMQESASPK